MRPGLDRLGCERDRKFFLVLPAGAQAAIGFGGDALGTLVPRRLCSIFGCGSLRSGLRESAKEIVNIQVRDLPRIRQKFFSGDGVGVSIAL